MKLSIITINYNDKMGLENTIKSVISQTFRDFQYIVVDGGSTDGSKDILNKYKDKLDVAISEKDSGIYNAMNKGAKFATGEYLLFLNSGDTLFDDTALEQVFKNSPQDDIVACQCIDYDEKNTYLKIPPKNVSLFTFTSASLPHPSSLIKSGLFKRVGGYIEENKVMSDWCFFVDALLIERCSYSTLPITLSKFNCFGISSTEPTIESDKYPLFLKKRFGRIIDDYLPLEDEAMCNCVFWISAQKGLTKRILKLPFTILNRLIGGRNTLSRRIGVKKTKIAPRRI